ncbi:hypothetical protein [Komagataeibacter sp. FNDCR2]|uniref:hypothetical protein n=1 Tax=Komagataeibacter sp. FNDCR2 TaxID=2878682 RepID=UPI001E5D5026|nr:hypothetical protein [Komagataeibacter sp. FNDCR2]MCE2575985.1 hypothetical protein [Komagataeibacter sp. FNDCR2]
MIDKHDHSVPFPPHVVVACARDLARVMAEPDALRLGCTVVSPPGAGCFMGAAWWAALLAGCPLPALLDCGQAAGYAAAALHAGVGGIIVAAPPAQHRTLVSLARDMGARVLRQRPPALELPPRGAGDALARYLHAHRQP